MKKRTAIILFAAVAVIILAVAGVFLYERSIVAMTIEMKVIITKDGTVARYVSEDETSYACEGKGIVCLMDFGETNAYAQPSSDAEVVGKLNYEPGTSVKNM